MSTMRRVRPVDLKPGDKTADYEVLSVPHRTAHNNIQVAVRYRADGGLSIREWDSVVSGQACVPLVEADDNEHDNVRVGLTD